MFESISYLIKEHKQNLNRIISIARYEILAENRDSYLGFLWNILGPLIQIGTYWFVFGIGIRNGKPINGVPYMQWMLSGIIVWFFVSACLKKGTSAIHSKANVISKIKFPTSILVTTVVVSELFDHIIMIGIALILLLLQGFRPSIENLQLIYYMFCCVTFCISFGLVFSVLNMMTRDVKKFVTSTMRMLFYVTPILWTMENLPKSIQYVMKCNPIYYLVQGYRSSLFPTSGFGPDLTTTIIFWIINISLFSIGSILTYRNRYKFIDLM
ncbi:ABC transporter permease [Terrisporobacter sp.]